VETDATSAPPARIGTPAPSQRIWFVPTLVVLPGGAKAPVFPASTVNGELGELVVLHGSGHIATYRVSSVVSVPKGALATRSGAFDQKVDHRLVLITCTGAYDASRGGYEDNLLVTATPVGPAR
jgi:hypothetical protein